MLVGFATRNFTSIGDEQKLCMTVGRVRSKPEHLYKSGQQKLLRFSAIYGSNASGKSNFVDAMSFAQMMILHGIPKGYTNAYNRTDANNINKPSLFAFNIRINNKTYTYGFEILLNKSSICTEWLRDSSHKDDILIFERDLADNKFKLGEQLLKSKSAERLKIYFDDTKNIDSVLFLREMNRNKEEIYKQDRKLSVFKDVFSWFRYCLDINYPDRPISNFHYFISAKQTEEVERILKHFGQGIINFNIVEADKEDYSKKIPADLFKDFIDHLENQTAKAIKAGKHVKSISGMIRSNKELYIMEIDINGKIHFKTIMFNHGKAGQYDIAEESDGTRRILELIEILFSTNRDKVYVIDEIDRSLHPLMTKEFVKYYLETLNDRNVQLIVTTHELRLMDLNMLRRDEIWFMDKDDNGNSTLYSLEAYNERFDMRVDKAYLNGRYNAIPKFGDDIG